MVGVHTDAKATSVVATGIYDLRMPADGYQHGAVINESDIQSLMRILRA